MAATWVSKIGCGTMFGRCQTISMSWRAAWNTFSTFSLAISSKNGLQVDALGERVDHDRFVGRSPSAPRRAGVIGGLAQEFGVDGDDRMLGERGASRRESEVVVIRSMNSP